MPEVPVDQLIAATGLQKPDLARLIGCSLATLYRWEQGQTIPKRAVIEFLKQRVETRQPKPSVAAQFRFIDLFAGIGGMRLGLERAGGACVFSSEWNSHSRATYLRNFPSVGLHPFPGDIREVAAELIPNHDFLAAGFPCQPFSIAGVSKKNALGRPHGFDCEEQGNLFFEIVRILEYHRPAGFLLENVKNLRSHDGGNTFKVIMKYLQKKLGYFVEPRVINAKGFVPQNRERIFIVGFREPTAFRFDRCRFPEAVDGPTLKSVLHPEDGSEPPEPPYTTGNDAHVADKYILTPHLWAYLRAYQKKHKALGHGFGFGLVGADDTARTLSARYFKDGSEILIKRGRGRPRRLTPRECSRLMGFDAPGRSDFAIPVSDTQAYRQFGNAVVTPVVEAVMKYVRPHLLSVMTGRPVQADEHWPGYDSDSQLELFDSA